MYECECLFDLEEQHKHWCMTVHEYEDIRWLWPCYCFTTYSRLINCQRVSERKREREHNEKHLYIICTDLKSDFANRTTKQLSLNYFKKPTATKWEKTSFTACIIARRSSPISPKRQFCICEHSQFTLFKCSVVSSCCPRLEHCLIFKLKLHTHTHTLSFSFLCAVPKLLWSLSLAIAEKLWAYHSPILYDELLIFNSFFSFTFVSHCHLRISYVSVPLQLSLPLSLSLSLLLLRWIVTQSYK